MTTGIKSVAGSSTLKIGGFVIQHHAGVSANPVDSIALHDQQSEVGVLRLRIEADFYGIRLPLPNHFGYVRPGLVRVFGIEKMGAGEYQPRRHKKARTTIRNPNHTVFEQSLQSCRGPTVLCAV